MVALMMTILAIPTLVGQTQKSGPQFEVASIKLNTVGDEKRFIFGSSAGGRLTIVNNDFENLGWFQTGEV